MANHRNRFPARRRFLKQSTALTASVVALPLPALGRAQPSDAPVSPDEKRDIGAPAQNAPQPTPLPRRRDVKR
jgi:hypothetical protein